MDRPAMNAATLAAQVAALGEISDEAGRLTRLYLSPAHRRAVATVADWMHEAGMTTETDAAANLVGRYAGATRDAPVLLIGSHLDTVRDAGRFDGALGVLIGLDVVRRLHASGRRLPFAIEVVGFGDEEGVRFASTLTGSRALAGRFDAATLEERDGEGKTRRAALAAFGCEPAAIGGLARDPGRVIGYVEAHIEQGPVLEAERLPLGVVTAINGASRGTVTIAGKASHAGTTPMAMRRDALAAAAEMILAVEGIARGEADLVATVGVVETLGGAVNTVPGRVRFSLDIRHPDDTARRAARQRIEATCAAIAERRGVAMDFTITYDAPATPCDRHLSDRLAEAVAQAGCSVRRLPSGAGHDAMAFREILPVAMLFVRCRAGLSHHPDEFASETDCALAAAALLRFVEALA
jgi:allantoate deiminase